MLWKKLSQKNDLVKLRKKTKTILRFTAKRHAHLQTLTKTPAMFQKDSSKTVGRVAFTRYPQCLYALVEVKHKNDLSSNCKKVTI